MRSATGSAAASGKGTGGNTGSAAGRLLPPRMYHMAVVDYFERRPDLAMKLIRTLGPKMWDLPPECYDGPEPDIILAARMAFWLGTAEISELAHLQDGATCNQPFIFSIIRDMARRESEGQSVLMAPEDPPIRAELPSLPLEPSPPESQHSSPPGSAGPPAFASSSSSPASDRYQCPSGGSSESEFDRFGGTAKAGSAAGPASRLT